MRADLVGCALTASLPDFQAVELRVVLLVYTRSFTTWFAFFLLFNILHTTFYLLLTDPMPITQSAKKALRQSGRRRTKNVARKDAYKKALKDVKRLVAKKMTGDLKAALSLAYQALDKAAKNGAIPKNTASRLKSRITRLVGR